MNLNTSMNNAQGFSLIIGLTVIFSGGLMAVGYSLWLGLAAYSLGLVVVQLVAYKPCKSKGAAYQTALLAANIAMFIAGLLVPMYAAACLGHNALALACGLYLVGLGGSFALVEKAISKPRQHLCRWSY